MEIKLYNTIKKRYEQFTIKKVEVGNLPYQLAFRKFLLHNGFSLSQSFGNIDKLQNSFDAIYEY